MNQNQESNQHGKKRVFTIVIFGFLLLASIFYILYLITHQTTFEGLGVLAFISLGIASVTKDILEKERKNAEKQKK